MSIPKEHFQTLKDERTDKLMVSDIVLQIVVPVAAGAACFISGWHLIGASNAIVGISIVAALMCAMAVLVFQIRLSLRDSETHQTRDIALIDELFANIMWAILVGLVLALYLIVCEAIDLTRFAHAPEVASAVGVAFCLHFVFVIGMCLKRLQSAYQRIASK